uniref:Uncharacterized protein n=1 Tax=Xenopus tropicalis TaxID=8364 RepID=A0A1B8Y9T4_XENTR
MPLYFSLFPNNSIILSPQLSDPYGLDRARCRRYLYGCFYVEPRGKGRELITVEKKSNNRVNYGQTFKVNSSFPANSPRHSRPLNRRHLENLRLSDIYFNILTWTLGICRCERIQLEPCRSVQMPRVRLGSSTARLPSLYICVWIGSQKMEIFSGVGTDICLLHFAKKFSYFSKISAATNVELSDLSQTLVSVSSPGTEPPATNSLIHSMFPVPFLNLTFTAFSYLSASSSNSLGTYLVLPTPISVGK